MDNNTSATAALAPQDDGGLDKLNQAMRDCEPDRKALIADLEPLFRAVWTESLECLETVLPNFRELGSADAKLHAALRRRILNCGNNQSREQAAKVVKSYFVQQVFQRQVTTYTVATHGIHRLPVGVEMPSAMPGRTGN